MSRPVLILFFCVCPLWVFAQSPQAVLHPSGLPIPRFVALKSDDINVRVGPGTRYPIAWVYRKEYYPVEIIEEFGHWRKIRDHESSEGWVHKNLLSGKRSGMVRGKTQKMYEKPDTASGIVAQVESGVVGLVKSCTKDWCKLSIAEREGWMHKQSLWGIYSEEEFDD